MDIEKLKLLVSLKCGEKTYSPGEYVVPIPKDLIDEIRVGSEIIEIISPPVAKEYQKIVMEEKKKEAENFLNSWIHMEAEPFKAFAKENLGKLSQYSLLDKARSKWYRLFPSLPFPDVAVEESSTTEEKNEKTVEIEKTKKPSLRKRKNG